MKTMRDAEIIEDREGREAAMLAGRDRLHFAVTELVALIEKSGPVEIMATELLLEDDAADFAVPASERLLFKKLARLLKGARK